MQPPEADVGTDEEKQPLIVLGGGIAGLTAADRLARPGQRVVVLEGSDHLGGAHRSVEIGPFTFDVGSIFYEDNSRIFDLADELREMCPQVFRKQRRIAPDGTLLHYPIEPRDLLLWPKPRVAGALAAMMVARATKRRDGTLEGACLARLGAPFFEHTGLRNYTIRFNGMDPDQIDEEFYDHRMAFIHRSTDTASMVRSAWRALRRKSFRRGPRKPLRIRPRGGYSVMFDMVRRSLEARGVTFVLNTPVERIVNTDSGFVVTAGGRTFEGCAVIGALPLDILHRATFGESSNLESLDLQTLFVSADCLSEQTGNVLFNFHPDGKWKRATIYSRLYPEQSGLRPHFSVERTVFPADNVDPEETFADLKSHVERLGIASGLRLEGSTVVPNAYPLYRPGHSGDASTILDRITANGVIAIGRQARFEYLPTATGVVRRTVEELEAAGLFGN